VTPEIIGVGMATMDRLYLLEDYSAGPAGRVLDYSVQGGGPVATAMAAASALGASCGLIACVGDDELGQEIRGTLHAASVDTSRMLVKPRQSSPMVLVLVDARTGDRHFFPMNGDRPLVGADDIDWDYASRARIFCLDHWITDMGAVLERARALGLITIVDSALHMGLEPGWVGLADVFIASADSERWRADPDAAVEEAGRIAGRGPHTTILTLGAAGCAGVGPEGPFTLPAFDVNVVDTTGTGDVFHGAYAYALTSEWKAEDCARFASAAAALSATRLGGRAGLPAAGHVAELLHSQAQAGPWDT
jgi:sugar/nucleoside kinase (ribokinase family)